MSAPAMQVWAGAFETEAMLDDLVAEIWPDEDEDDDSPISRFAASQGAIWLDHDFMETLWADPGQSLKERFAGASYIDNWAPRAERRIEELGLTGINAIILLGDGGGGAQFETPRDAQGAGWRLHYLGRL